MRRGFIATNEDSPCKCQDVHSHLSVHVVLVWVYASKDRALDSRSPRCTGVNKTSFASRSSCDPNEYKSWTQCLDWNGASISDKWWQSMAIVSFMCRWAMRGAPLSQLIVPDEDSHDQSRASGEFTRAMRDYSHWRMLRIGLGLNTPPCESLERQISISCSLFLVMMEVIVSKPALRVSRIFKTLL